MTEEWATWHLVKYQPDVRRGEPINVGIIVTAGNGRQMQFLGEEPGTTALDGRKVKGTFGSADNYKRWVTYFQRSAEQERLDHVVSRWRERRAESSIYVGDPGRIRLADADLAEVTRRLFAELVTPRRPESQAAEGREDRLKQVFGALQIEPQEHPEFLVQLDGAAIGRVSFGYGYQNGQLHLIDQLNLSRQARLYANDFNQRAQLARDSDVARSLVAFYTLPEQKLGSEDETALRVLERHAHTINLDDDQVVDQAAEALGVA